MPFICFIFVFFLFASFPLFLFAYSEKKDSVLVSQIIKCQFTSVANIILWCVLSIYMSWYVFICVRCLFSSVPLMFCFLTSNTLMTLHVSDNHTPMGFSRNFVSIAWLSLSPQPTTTTTTINIGKPNVDINAIHKIQLHSGFLGPVAITLITIRKNGFSSDFDHISVQ